MTLQQLAQRIAQESLVRVHTGAIDHRDYETVMEAAEELAMAEGMADVVNVSKVSTPEIRQIRRMVLAELDTYTTLESIAALMVLVADEWCAMHEVDCEDIHADGFSGSRTENGEEFALLASWPIACNDLGNAGRFPL